MPTVLTASAAHLYTMDTLNRSESTKRIYRMVEERFCAFLRERKYGGDAAVDPPLTDLTLEHARAFVLWVKAGHSTNALTKQPTTRGAKTVHEHANALKSFAHFCVAEGYLRNDPLVKFKLPKFQPRVTRLLSRQEVRAFFAVIERHALRERNLAMFYLLLATGLRAAELCDLSRDDVDLRSRRVKVIGKGDKLRWVTFDSVTGRHLARYMAERGKAPPDQLFLTRDGKPYHRGALLQLARDLGREAEIPDCHPHQFRVVFATWFLIGNPNAVFQLQELLGHSDLGMVRRYARQAEVSRELTGPSVVEALGLDHNPPRSGR